MTVRWDEDPVLASCTVEACAKCGDSYCEPCPKCGACSVNRCACAPDESTAMFEGDNCESCGGPIHMGDRVHLYADDISTHVECPTSRQRARA